MIEIIKSFTSNPIAQFFTAVFVGFYLVSLAGELLEKFNWYRTFMMGKEDDT